MNGYIAIISTKFMTLLIRFYKISNQDIILYVINMRKNVRLIN